MQLIPSSRSCSDSSSMASDSQSRRSKSNQNSRELAPSPPKSLFSKNPEYYLPRFASEGKDPQLTKVAFTVEQEPDTGRIYYKFNVEWIDGSDEPGIRYSEIKKTVREHRKSNNKEGHRCDGPCREMLASGAEIHQFGLCDHNICSNCFHKEYSVKLYDGTPGCCNPQCVDKDLNVVEEMISGNPHASLSACQSLTQLSSGVTECVVLKILHFEKDKRGRTIRKRYEREVASSRKLNEIQYILENLIPALTACQVFYSTKTGEGKHDLIKLPAFDKVRISSLLKDSDELKFVILSPGVRFK